MADYDIAGVDGDLLLSRHGALHRLFVYGSDRRSTARAARRWASMATRKDYRPDLKQMILGFVVDGSGSPLCTEMWPGNIADVTTLLPLIDRLRQRPRASPPVPRRATLRHRPRLRRGRPRHDLGRHHRRARRAPADEDRALDRKLKGTVLEQLGEHAAMPSRSQIRRNSKGPPMRLAATDNDPSASASSALMSNTCQ